MNIFNQLGSGMNPMSLMMSMLNPHQRGNVTDFSRKSIQDQAEELAKLCNAKGISKEQLQNIIKMFGNK